LAGSDEIEDEERSTGAQLRLRLARALDLLAQYDDLTSLSLDLGFSGYSHFSAAFREAYGRPPSDFRQSALHR
jgi:AraC family transcriptional regulator